MEQEKSKNQESFTDDDANEPSMEDILASIRQVMDGTQEAAEDAVEVLESSAEEDDSLSGDPEALEAEAPEVTEEATSQAPPSEVSKEVVSEASAAEEDSEEIFELTEVIEDTADETLADETKAPTVAEMLEATESETLADETLSPEEAQSDSDEMATVDLVFDDMDASESETTNDKEISAQNADFLQENILPEPDIDMKAEAKVQDTHDFDEPSFDDMGDNMSNDSPKINGADAHASASQAPSSRPGAGPSISEARTSTSEDWLVSEQSVADSTDSLARIASIVDGARHVNLGHGNKTVEDITKELLKPLMKSWLDENLPSIVDSLVRQEINRLISRLERR